MKERLPPADQKVSRLLSHSASWLVRLDRLVHEPARLTVLAILAVSGAAEFVFVQQKAGLTAGNLATHLTRLETAGLVQVSKTFVDRRPCTVLTLTAAGRAALAAWRQQMVRLLGLLA